MKFNHGLIPSVNNRKIEHFSQAPSVHHSRSVFDRSYGCKTSFNMGEIVPILCDEVVPGDTFSCDFTGFARLATLITPIMDNIFIDVHYFFVPNRLVWDSWEDFITGNNTSITTPVITLNSSAAGWMQTMTLWDYFGLPVVSSFTLTNAADIPNVSALPFRGYALIWNEWYADQNINTQITINTSNTNDAITAYTLQYRNKKRDYFTSCLPWPQKGVQVSLPLGTVAPVTSTGAIPQFRCPNSGGTLFNLVGTTAATSVTTSATIASGGSIAFDSVGNQTGLQTDLSTATAATIDQLRQAFQVQRCFERDARSGTRYTEHLQGHWGVISPDARLQRPEFLSQGSWPVQIVPVAQTSATGSYADTPQATLASFGVSAIRKSGFTKSFVEHGFLFGLLSSRADLTYQQGINRMWTRQTRFQYYLPVLQQLGEQPVYTQEIYFDGVIAGAPTTVFGYQEAWAEYRYKPAQIMGIFRSLVTTNPSGSTTSLDTWHLSQDFSGFPALNTNFLQYGGNASFSLTGSAGVPMARIKAAVTEPDFILDAYFKLRVARLMPTWSIPGHVDHH